MDELILARAQALAGEQQRCWVGRAYVSLSQGMLSRIVGMLCAELPAHGCCERTSGLCNWWVSIVCDTKWVLLRKSAIAVCTVDVPCGCTLHVSRYCVLLMALLVGTVRAHCLCARFIGTALMPLLLLLLLLLLLMLLLRLLLQPSLCYPTK